MACKHWQEGKHARSEEPCPWCEIERLRAALEQIAVAFYSAPEVLRGMACTALTAVPNKEVSEGENGK